LEDEQIKKRLISLVPEDPDYEDPRKKWKTMKEKKQAFKLAESELIIGTENEVIVNTKVTDNLKNLKAKE
jgi:hypothetical protein